MTSVKGEILSIRYPSLEQVELLHGRILQLTGGEPGHLSKSNLEYLLEAVKNVGERLDRKQAIAKKAAFLLHNLVVLHPFVNGNKRTAFELVRLFLQLNGYEIKAESKAVYTFLADLAAGKASLAMVEKWMATNLAQARQE